MHTSSAISAERRGPKGGTRRKATRSGIFVASKNNQLSRTHQSDPGVSYTIRSAGAMQVVFFCQCRMTEVVSFFRSETFWGCLWSKLRICFTYQFFLISVTEILNGGVKISNNPKLCNMDTVLWNDIIDTSKKPPTVLEFASNLSSCEY